MKPEDDHASRDYETEIAYLNRQLRDLRASADKRIAELRQEIAGHEEAGIHFRVISPSSGRADAQAQLRVLSRNTIVRVTVKSADGHEETYTLCPPAE